MSDLEYLIQEIENSEDEIYRLQKWIAKCQKDISLFHAYAKKGDRVEFKGRVYVITDSNYEIASSGNKEIVFYATMLKKDGSLFKYKKEKFPNCYFGKKGIVKFI